MKLLIICVLLTINYGVTHSTKLTEEKIQELLTKNYFLGVIESLPSKISEHIDVENDFVIEAGITMEEYLTEHNYTHESHTVTTADGYILGLDRITGTTNTSSNTVEYTAKPAVLIMHGMTSSSVDWVMIGPGRALPLLLADAGYDVWLGNNRGNTWSRKHVTLDPDLNDTFWDYSFHELGVYDLPAFIDRILNETGKEKLSYIGHSQGCTEFFVMASMLPEYNDKILISALLAPPAYMGNVSQPFLQMFKDELELIESASKVLGVNEVAQHFRIYNKLATNLCNQPFYLPICIFPLEVGNGLNFLQVDTDVYSKLMLSYPSAASIRQIGHYAQEIHSGYFRQYDYGTIDNFLKYGQLDPPKYDLTKISVPIGLFYSVNDVFVNSVERIYNELPNVVLVHEISDKFFTHLDFVVAREVDKLLNVYVIELLASYNN